MRITTRSTRTAIASAALAAALVIVVSATSAASEGCTTYGAGVTLAAATPAARIAAAPDAFAGKTVRVEGEVREVCAMAGCWLSIVAEAGEAPLRVKVEDGEIVFPLSARGQRAAAQGEVEVRDMTREQYAAWRAHLAEERGEAFDPAAVGDGPYLHVQVKATGAELCPAAE
ncbi:MAG TPA: DUF4920 domain-containing protein [Thermoanaerobaculia bacterium]|nr:DUF4920 domain-containing protein [Thermoanaerobaculia bacterium]